MEGGGLEAGARIRLRVETLSVALRCARHVLVHLLIGLLDLLGDLAEALQEALKTHVLSFRRPRF